MRAAQQHIVRPEQRHHYEKIFFDKHDYLLLFRVKGSVAEVIGMFHMREEYWKKV